MTPTMNLCFFYLLLLSPFFASGVSGKGAYGLDSSGNGNKLKFAPTSLLGTTTTSTTKSYSECRLIPWGGYGQKIPDPSPGPLPIPEKPALKFKWMPLRSILKFLKVYVLQGAVLYGMFVINAIFAALFVVLKFWMKKITLRRFAGFMMTYTM